MILLKSLKSIDIQDGLLRIGGDEKFYQELLSEFAQEYKESSEQYRKLITQEDKEPARRLIHTIKGVAGNLGAKELYENAAKLESAIKKKEQDLADKLFPGFQMSLENVINEIEKSGLLLPEKQIGSEGENTDRSTLLALLSDFAEYARNRKAKPANDILKKITTYKWPENTYSSLNEISTLTKKYKLKEAAEKAIILLNNFQEI